MYQVNDVNASLLALFAKVFLAAATWDLLFRSAALSWCACPEACVKRVEKLACTYLSDNLSETDSSTNFMKQPVHDKHYNYKHKQASIRHQKASQGIVRHKGP